MSQQTFSGTLQKMVAQIAADHSPSEVVYQLPVGEHRIPLNPLLGKPITLHFQQAIFCCHCGKKTNKSFSQGYCYPCFRKLPQCDACIMSPEKCHYHQGTCRDSAWGEEFCMTDHIVYLANSSGIKVGITRASQIPTRWIDQGATQAVPIMRVATRQLSGFVEVLFKHYVADKTNWRTMLKGSAAPIDLIAEAKILLAKVQADIEALQAQHGLQALQPLIETDNTASITEITYPVLQYPSKVTSLSFDKTPTIESVLLGIKGQYLILDSGVINIRKHTAYQVSVTI